MTQAGAVQLNIGDTVPLGQAMVNLIVMGLVTDINNPNMFAIKPQAFHKQAVLEADGLQGIQGIPGQLTFALRWQNDNLIQPSQLPITLTNLPRDLGKFWIFGVTDQNGNTVATIMYVWWGTVIGFRSLPVGTPGPVGRFPLITPNIVLQVPGTGLGPGGVDSWIAVTGPVSNPVYTYNIASPLGPPGPPTLLGAMPDVDFVSHVPVPGDVLVCSSSAVPGAPTGLGILPHNVGGTLAAGIYFYVVTAYLPNGQETLPSNEVTTDMMTGNTNTVDLFWNSVPAGIQPVGYKVYRGTSIGAQNRLVATIANPAATSFTDTGAATTAGTPPFAGAPVAGRSMWRAATPNPIFPAFYTVPESAFTPLFSIDGSNQTVVTFAVPPQSFAWKPLVFGQMQIFGVNFTSNPFLVGAEVLLGDPDPTKGTQVAQGFGNDEGYVSLFPQISTPAKPSVAITPDNMLGYVPPNHTGNAGTLYCNLVNQGMFGLFNFQNANSGLAVVTIPVVPQ